MEWCTRPGGEWHQRRQGCVGVGCSIKGIRSLAGRWLEPPHLHTHLVSRSSRWRSCCWHPLMPPPLDTPHAHPPTPPQPPPVARYGTLVAAKILKGSSEIALGDFRGEIEILRRVHHPNAVQVRRGGAAGDGVAGDGVAGWVGGWAGRRNQRWARARSRHPLPCSSSAGAYTSASCFAI